MNIQKIDQRYKGAAFEKDGCKMVTCNPVLHDTWKTVCDAIS
jgi:hypothetical protein